jgi:uncharacterized protein
VQKSALIGRLRREFRLDWRGIHGAAHWARVRYTGVQLARLNGARRDVIECFALLHDSQRWSDYKDPGHGSRAAAFVRKINDDLLQLDAPGLELLVYACTEHSNGLTEGDITVQTCWDADRLDLGRVGIRVRDIKLCTPQAQERQFMQSAYGRGLRLR